MPALGHLHLDDLALSFGAGVLVLVFLEIDLEAPMARTTAVLALGTNHPAVACPVSSDHG